MTHSRQDSTFWRFFSSRLFFLLSVLVLGMISLSVGRAYYQDYLVEQEIRSLEERVELLRRKRFESLDILAYVLSPAFVEEKARTELNMKKEGEQVVVIPEQDLLALRRDEDSSTVSTGQQPSNLVQWWYYFFGWY